MDHHAIYTGLSGQQRIELPLKMANRHGLIAGASGTGKTVTMKVLAENFSKAGVPCFICDIKGDVSGLAEPGTPSEDMSRRIEKFGLQDTFQFEAFPVHFWDVYQQNGHPVRITVSDLGADLLSRLLQLSAAQDGVLHILFQIADDQGLLLHDLKDLKALIDYIKDNREDFTNKYGNISAQSLAAIQRAILPLEQQGGDLFFGLPALNLHDWITKENGMGVIQLLDCTRLYLNPLLYAAFLLWLLSELFEILPEAGDLDQPKLVLFFDEAHLIFDDAPKALVSKIEQVVKLIRSKGVGIYFISQSISDIPGPVLSQLSNRIQHGLRAYTPAEQKALKAAAQSFRTNPDLDTLQALQQLGTGQALISFLDEGGIPSMVVQADIVPPESSFSPVSEEKRKASMSTDGLSRYDQSEDQISASEKLAEEKARAQEQARLEAQRKELEEQRIAFEKQRAKEEAAAAKKAEKEAEAARKKKEKEEERKALQKEREAQKRKERIERAVFNTGANILKRTLMNTLKKR